MLFQSGVFHWKGFLHEDTLKQHFPQTPDLSATQRPTKMLSLSRQTPCEAPLGVVRPVSGTLAAGGPWASGFPAAGARPGMHTCAGCTDVALLSGES